MGKRDKYNSFGYLDMTPYLAIRKIERDEETKNTKKKLKFKNGSYHPNKKETSG